MSFFEPYTDTSPPDHLVNDANAANDADWFVREVKRCRALGMPVGCCDEWPKCSHVLAWTEERLGAL